MKTIKLQLMTWLISISALAMAQSGEIRGVLKNDLKETVPFATVKIMQGSQLIGGTQSDVEGNYVYKPLNPGSYDVIVYEAGHQTKQISGVKVTPSEATYLNMKLTSNTFSTVVVTGKIEKEDYTKSGCNTTMYSMASIDATELLQNSSFDHVSIISAVTSLASDLVVDASGGLHFRGGRSDANGFYMDGVKVLSMDSAPGLGIENITVFSGGVPAMYGDVTGGVVIVTTKSYFSGIREKNMRNRRANEKRAEKKEREKEEMEKAAGIFFQ